MLELHVEGFEASSSLFSGSQFVVAHSAFVVQNSKISESCPISELSLYSNHWKQKAHKFSKNLVCEQSLSKGSGDENKVNAFIMLIKEQRHHDFSGAYSSLHWKFHKWESFPQYSLCFSSCFAPQVHCRPGTGSTFIMRNFLALCTIYPWCIAFPIPGRNIKIMVVQV